MVETASAAPEGSTRSIAAPLTRDGAVLGTAAYMSPEQARAARVDHRADVFALGVTLYEMLSGRAAFQRRSSLDTLQAVLGDPVPELPPSREATTEVTAEVQRIIRKATAKDPDDRYQGMKDLVVDLRAVRRRLESSEDLSRAVSAVAPRPARSSKVVPVAAALAGILILLSLAAMWWSRPDPPAALASGKPGIAVMYFENNTGDASLDWMRTGLANMLVTNLSQSSEFEVVGTDRVVQILQDLGRERDTVISADVIQTVAERARVGNVLVGSYVRAGGIIRISARLQDAVSGRIVTAERVEGQGESSLFQLVDDLTQRFRSRLAALAGPAPTLAITPPGADNDRGLDRGLTSVTTASIEAYRHYSEGRTAEADRLVAELEQLSQVLPTRRDTRRVHWTKGEILRRRGDPRAALPELRKALDLLSASAPALGPPQPHLDFMLSAALAHRDAGESGEAIRLLEQLQARHERSFNPDAWVRSFYLLGDLYEQQGDTERSRQQYRRFVELWGDGELERGWVTRARQKSSR